MFFADLILTLGEAVSASHTSVATANNGNMYKTTWKTQAEHSVALVMGYHGILTKKFQHRIQ